MTLINRTGNTRVISKTNIIIYFLLLFKAGFFFNEQYTRFSAPLLLVFVLIINGTRVIRFNNNSVLFFLAYLVLLLINFLLNGFPSLEQVGVVIINLITSLLICNLISVNDFCDSFRQVIFAICIASIIGFLIMLRFKNLFSFIPALTNSNGIIGRYAVLTILSDFSSSTSGLQRAQGIFWEPGAFQSMIIVSMIIELFKTNTLNWKRLLVYALTIIVTFSTTGYACLLLMLVLSVNKESGPYTFMKILLVIGALAFFYYSLQDTSIRFLQYTLFGKIQMILNYQPGVTNYASSRIDSIVLPLKYFYINPIFGIGERGYKIISNVAGHTMFTCTPINYFIRYGFLFGGLTAYGFYKFFYNKGISLINGLILTACLLITFSTENFTLNSILTCMIMYGYINNNKKELENNE